MRGALLLLLTAGLIGIAAELLLLDHTEDLLQWIPLALVAVALVHHRLPPRITYPRRPPDAVRDTP